MRKISGGVTAAIGFSAASCMAGIKYQNRTDMAMVFSDTPCAAAGTFTSNVVKAAPVVWDREIVKSAQPVQAVVINSGIANAGTGAEGMRICEKTAETVSRRLNIPARSVLIGSTGVIGMQIPLARIEAGVDLLADGLGHSAEKGTEASR
ncbi:MAG: bifunctional ornithine acetyltransferase/N-acetylglutamate synthase, partial [Clostridia bacterium]|nr:bifunctional ornithine acetyltransferase/N-acetylglutamate synthase [Clostridia bacterium]